jgi:hypothetical protein
MTRVMQFVRGVLPARVRHFLRARHRAFVWWLAMHRLLRHPETAAALHSSVIAGLIYGWGYEGTSALEEYLAACAQAAIAAKGAILECGSGLTTIVVGVIAQRFGKTLWSLEHIAPWGAMVEKNLQKYHVAGVHLHTHPLKEHGDFAWYDPPLDAMPDSFSLIVCDGPPGGTHGGRYGLAPVMRERLGPGCVILLDDAKREGIRATAQRWGAELGATYELLGVHKPYIRMVVGNRRRPSMAPAP